MADEQQQEQVEDPQGGVTTEEKPKEQDKPAPPWGSDEEFDPGKAWKLIQDLRADKDKLKPLADKARELEQAQMSEVDKLQSRVAELEPAAKEAARLRVALTKGLTLTQAKRLVGDTEEELSADADELLADIGTTPNLPSRPAGQGGGSAPSDATETRSPADLADAVMKRQRGF